MNAPPVDDDDRSRDGLQAVARGGVLNLVTAALGAVLGFFLVILVGRGLGPSGAGVFFTSIGLFTILSTILELGAPMALVRSVAARQELETPHDLPLLASISIVPVLVIGTVVAIVAYILIDQIVSVLFSPAERSQGAEFLRVLIPFIPLAAGASVALGGTRGFGSMVPFVLVRNLGKPILRPILTGAAILAGFGASAIALAWVIPAGLEFPVALLAFLVLLRRATSGVRGSREGDAPPVRRLAAEFWRFAAPRGVAATFQTLVLWMDVLLVGAMTSTRQAGIYATASRFVLLGTLAIEAVRLAIAPQLGAMFARNDLAGAQRMYGVATWWLMVPSWPVYVVIAAFAPVFLRLFGAGVRGGSGRAGDPLDRDAVQHRNRERDGGAPDGREERVEPRQCAHRVRHQPRPQPLVDPAVRDHGRGHRVDGQHRLGEPRPARPDPTGVRAHAVREGDTCGWRRLPWSCSGASRS